jgi:hypothetical protein
MRMPVATRYPKLTELTARKMVIPTLSYASVSSEKQLRMRDGLETAMPGHGARRVAETVGMTVA